MKKIIFVTALFLWIIFCSANVSMIVKTDAKYYCAGDTIQISITLHNSGPDTIRFNWPTSCQAIYSINEQKPNLTCAQVLTALILYPDSTHTWILKHTDELFPVYPGTHILKAEIIDYEHYFAYQSFSYGQLSLTAHSKAVCDTGHCDSAYISLTVENDALKLFWQTPQLNACLEPLWGGWLKGDTFHVAMVDTGALCDCENYFHLEANFSSFPPDEYILDFENGNYGYPRFSIEPVSIGRQQLPKTMSLYQNYPNPFNNSTSILFSCDASATVLLDIFDLKGRKIKTLLKNTIQPGEHILTWDATDTFGQVVSSGIYFYRLRFSEKNKALNDYTLVRRMLLLK